MANTEKRYSQQRETILNIVRHTDTHPNADWVYAETRKIIPNVSLGTVYRNLNHLVESGQIMALKDKSMVRYDGNAMDHDHFQCDTCGTWYDVEILTPENLLALKRNLNFQIKSVIAEARGTCANCLNQ